jgi:hypothetical protein
MKKSVGHPETDALYQSRLRLAMVTSRLVRLVSRGPIVLRLCILIDRARTTGCLGVLVAGSVVGHGRRERGNTNRE